MWSMTKGFADIPVRRVWIPLSPLRHLASMTALRWSDHSDLYEVATAG